MPRRLLWGHRSAALLLGLIAVIRGIAAAQEPTLQVSPDSAVAPAPTSGKSWRLMPTLGIAAEYDNNVFLLDSAGESNLAAPSPGEVTSGRYANMESASDVITTFSGTFGVRGPGLSGKALTIMPAVAYQLYSQNPERSYVVVGLALIQNMPKKGRLRLQGSMTPSYFAKNYLADAVDGNGNGSISSSERVYAAGVYRESEVTLDYRFRLNESTKKHPFGATLQLGTGYGDRSYDPPFEGKDLSGPMAAASLQMTLSERVSLGLNYAFAAFAGTPTDQVLLLDEPDFGQDFNGNGTTTDPNVRVVSPVDPSRTDNAFGGELGFVMGKRSALNLRYEYRIRSYSSTEALDVTHNGRQDDRSRMGAQFGVGFGKAMGVSLGGMYTSQTTNRPNDPGATGDNNDYTRFQAALGLSYNF